MWKERLFEIILSVSYSIFVILELGTFNGIAAIIGTAIILWSIYDTDKKNDKKKQIKR